MCASSNNSDDHSIQIWPSTADVVTWPPPKMMNDEEFEAFARGEHLRFTDADGNEVKVTPAYPGNEMYLDRDGWHSNLIWEDHKEPLKWSRLQGRWRRAFWNWLRGPR